MRSRRYRIAQNINAWFRPLWLTLELFGCGLVDDERALISSQQFIIYFFFFRRSLLLAYRWFCIWQVQELFLSLGHFLFIIFWLRSYLLFNGIIPWQLSTFPSHFLYLIFFILWCSCFLLLLVSDDEGLILIA